MLIQSFKKPWVCGLISVALMLLIAFPGMGISVDQVSNPRVHSGGWITDQAQVLNADVETQLNQKIMEFEAQTTGEIAVVTIPQADQPVRLFATTLFNRWGIGKARSNNGVLLLLSMGDRRVEIVTGYGTEKFLTNAIAAEIIEEDILPAMRQRDPNQAVIRGTDRIIDILSTTDFLTANPLTLDFKFSLGISSLLFLLPLAITFLRRRQQFQWLNVSNAKFNSYFFLWLLPILNLGFAICGQYYPEFIMFGVASGFVLGYWLKTMMMRNRYSLSSKLFGGLWVGVMSLGWFGFLGHHLLAMQYKEMLMVWIWTLILAVFESAICAVNWTRLQAKSSGYTASATGTYSGGVSGGGGSGAAGGSAGGGFGGGSSGGGGAGGGW